jgi:hypothetical protein
MPVRSPQRTTASSGTVRHFCPSSSTETRPGPALRSAVTLGGCDLVRGLLGRLGLGVGVLLARLDSVVADRQEPR